MTNMRHSDRNLDKTVLGRTILERTVDDRIKLVVDGAVQRYLGVGIENTLSSDISDRLKKDSLLFFYINTKTGFKVAKKNFKKHYLEKILSIHSGNVSTSARVAGLDRRSIHRLMTELGIAVDREKLVKDNYTGSVQDMISNTLKRSEMSNSIEKMYKRMMPSLSREIVRELPSLSLKEAEQEFERRFIRKALEENRNNISQTARTIGLRFETLHRKMSSLAL